MSRHKGFGEQAALCASGSAWTLQGKGSVQPIRTGFFGVGSAHVLDKPDAGCAGRSGAEVDALVTDLQAISGS